MGGLAATLARTMGFTLGGGGGGVSGMDPASRVIDFLKTACLQVMPCGLGGLVAGAGGAGAGGMGAAGGIISTIQEVLKGGGLGTGPLGMPLPFPFPGGGGGGGLPFPFPFPGGGGGGGLFGGLMGGLFGSGGNITVPGQIEGGVDLGFPPFLQYQQQLGAPSSQGGDPEVAGAIGTLIPSLDKLSGFVSQLVGVGPIIADETVNNLLAFGEAFKAPVQSFVAQVDKLSQIFATNIQLQILPPNKPIEFNVNIGGMENIMNKLQQVVAVEMFTAVQAEVEKQLEPLKKNLGGLGGNNMNMNIN